MLRNRSCSTPLVPMRRLVALVQISSMAILLGAALVSCAQAQEAGKQTKPLPAKSKPTAFYTPEGQQQLADAILTDAVDQMWVQADAHWHKGEYNHYVNISRVIVQGDPRNVEAYSNSAYLLWSTGRNDDATAFLKQGLAANSDSYYMFDELGAHYYYHLKDYANALPYYEKAVQFTSPYITWSGLAHCYEKVNQWDKAVKTWEKVTALVPKGGSETQMQISETAKHNLARAKAELAKRQK